MRLAAVARVADLTQLLACLHPVADADQQRPAPQVGVGDVGAVAVVDDHVVAEDEPGTAHLAEQPLDEHQVRHRGPRLPGEVVALAARSEEHTSELQSLMRISYAVFCLKKKT